MIKAEWTKADALDLQPTCNNLATDAISRQAAIDHIECLYRDTAKNESYMIIGYNHAVSDALAIIKSLPSAQPEIIRCNSCRHDNNCEIQYAAQAGSKFFCGYAERREESE